MSIHWRELSTSQKIEAVKSAWYSGISAREIAAHFNGATRNAIIGLYGRYQEDLAATPLQKPTKSVVAMAKANTGRNFTVRRARRLTTPDFEAEPFKPPEPEATEWHLCGRPLMLIAKGQCRFPVNDAAIGETHLFCCMPAEKSFCDFHQKRAFTKPKRSLDGLASFPTR